MFVTSQAIDIFISYAHADIETAKAIAEALDQQRWSIWWDERLRSGDPFHDSIDQALRAAQCVVVLWSPASVKSHYVRWEASIGYDNDKLIPVKIAEVDSTPYHELHYCTIPGADRQDLGHSLSLARLVDDIALKIGSPPTELSRVIAATLDKRPSELSARDYSRVATLIVQDRPVRDITLLQELVNLEVLVLKGTQVRELRPLAKLARLQRLGLRSTLVTDVRHLSNLMQLQELSLVNTRVTDLRALGGLKKLEQLHLRHSDVSNLEPLLGMTALRCLYLGGTPVTNLKPLRDVTTLERLGLRDTAVTDLTPLENLTRLQELILNGTPVTELTPLLGLTGLRFLDLSNTSVPEDQVERVRTALPNVVIHL